MCLYVYEEEPEVLARHMLLIHVLLDASLTSKERVETLLELHGNALLRQKTASYLGMFIWACQITAVMHNPLSSHAYASISA